MRQRPTLYGSTLLEVLISLTLVSGVLLVLVGVFASGFRLMSQSQEVTMATTVAEELQGFPPKPYPRVQRAHQEYLLDVRVLPVPGLESTIAVELTVRWGKDHALRWQEYFLP